MLAHPALVWPADSLTIEANPTRAIVPQLPGLSTAYTITVQSLSGLPVTLGVTGLPTGATAAFNPPSLQPPVGGTASSTLTVTVSLSTPVGSYPLNVTGIETSSPPIQRWVTVTLDVIIPTGDFQVSVSPNFLTINVTESKTAIVTVTAIASFSQGVPLSVTGLPAHVRVTFTPPVVTPPPAGTASSTMRIDAADAPGGTYPLTIVGVSGTATRSTPFTLAIWPNTIVGISTQSGLAFAVIAIGAGVAAAGVGVAVAASSRSGSEVFAYGGYYYCRKHRVPVSYVNGRLWCPFEQRHLRA